MNCNTCPDKYLKRPPQCSEDKSLWPSIAFTGGRSYKPGNQHIRTSIEFAMREIFRTPHTLHHTRFNVLHGGARGLDQAVHDYFSMFKCLVINVYMADWKKLGNAAGPIRSKAMVEQADLLIAFPGGKGTVGTINAAIALRKSIVSVSAEGTCKILARSVDHSDKPKFVQDELFNIIQKDGLVVCKPD